jgi:DNA helicase II / ATP-dependent DNA helicase PcrA
MEPFEAIRDSAARLHGELVSAGVDPFKPMALVEEALSRCELELFLLRPGDPALKGARAIFDDQSGSIFCEVTAEVGEGALLIGHEIGHVRVHATTSWCNANDIDPSRSTEAAPVGLQRVEDYGVRERRELQANVFAREFLLPRAWARQLYLEDGLGAGTMAERTGLPMNLVRQQLFDALLLPAAPASEASKSVLGQPVKPDSSQTRAAAHRGSPFQLQAGPGTGKTRTLVDRVISLIGEGIDPSAMLVLTFSNRAAGELAERIAILAPEAAPRVWIGTFHAFGLDLVRRYHDRFGLPPDPTLFDRSDAIEVLEEILPTLPLVHYRNLWDPALVLRDILGAISRAKDEMADPSRYRALAQTMAERARDEDERVAAEKCLEVAHVYDLYEKAMRNRGSVDFGDLIMRPALLIESDPSLRAALRLRHRHILVDEYQDVNRASARLLKVVAGDGKHLWVVGDSRQSIYRFRGASSSNMALFASDYPNTASDQLSMNYRSTQQVASTFLSVAPNMGASAGMLPLALTAERGNGPANPEIRRFDTLEDEAEGLAASIGELEAAGVPFCDQAVLCRTNGRLNELAEALESRGIPVLHLGSLFEREEVRNLLALLSLAVDRFGAGLTRVGAMGRYELSLQDVYLAVNQLREAERPALEGLSTLASTPGLSNAGAEGLARLARDLQGLSSSFSAWEFLAEYLLDRAELVREMARRESVADRMRSVAIWQFLNFAREQSPVSSGHRIQRTLDRVRQLVLLAEERDLRQVPTGALHMNAVRLMTIHGSKGLEFEAVHMPGLTAASFPSSYHPTRCPPPVGMIEGVDGLTVKEEAKQSQEHEEQCLFFVALSRARTYLRVYLSRLQSNGKNRSPSVFLSWLPTRIVVEVEDPKKIALVRGIGKANAVTVTYAADSSVTDSSLSAYQKCPRRYFYTHVLGLGTARKSTAFLRTHNCLYDLLRWLAEARRDGDTTVETAEQAFESIWKDRGPADHGFAGDYRRLASRLIAALVSSGAGRRFRDAEPIAIDFPNGRVIVEPNEMAELPNGTVVLRRLRTGRKRSDEYDNLEYTLYHLAGKARFGNAFSVEAIHLTDETVETVTVTAQKVSNRRATSDAMLQSIGRGLFPPEVDSVRCPRCPHFFVCDAMPKGPLLLP